jgi:hypothetical protein
MLALLSKSEKFIIIKAGGENGFISMLRLCGNHHRQQETIMIILIMIIIMKNGSKNN